MVLEPLFPAPDIIAADMISMAEKIISTAD
jgi:hypothetical protein